jgi:hypothetical protein
VAGRGQGWERRKPLLERVWLQVEGHSEGGLFSLIYTGDARDLARTVEMPSK